MTRRRWDDSNRRLCDSASCAKRGVLATVYARGEALCQWCDDEAQEMQADADAERRHEAIGMPLD